MASSSQVRLLLTVDQKYNLNRLKQRILLNQQHPFTFFMCLILILTLTIESIAIT